ncbi:MAG: hypothetical protein ACLPVJ_19245, partial [Syntrophobacteraceae bacterium]
AISVPLIKVLILFLNPADRQSVERAGYDFCAHWLRFVRVTEGGGWRASGPALGNLGVVFHRVVRATEDGGPPARRWAILEWCFTGLYAPRRTEDGRRKTENGGLRA